MTPLTDVHTKRCIHCHAGGVVKLTPDQYRRYHSGMHIQDALPELSAGVREQLLTGIHPECWDALFGGEEGEDW